MTQQTVKKAKLQKNKEKSRNNLDKARKRSHATGSNLSVVKNNGTTNLQVPGVLS